MEKPNTCVAVVSNISGGCQYVGKVKTITKTEYAKLVYEQRQQEQKEKQRFNELCDRVEDLMNQVYELKKQVAILKGEDYEESIED